MYHHGSLLFLITVCLLCASQCSCESAVNTLAALKAAQARIPSLYAAALTTYDAQGFRPDTSVAVGNYPIEKGGARPIFLDSMMRGTDAFEHLLVVVALLALGGNSTIAANLNPDSSIDAKYLPKGVNLVHPSFLGTPLTLRQLMTHTSSLQDNSRFDPAPQRSGTGTGIMDFNLFCEEYYTTSSTPPVVQQDIWVPNVQPGSADSYRPARANTALLAYILQKVIDLQGPALVAAQSTGKKTLAAYIQEQVFNKLGMSSTLWQMPNGAAPPMQLDRSVFGGRIVPDMTSAGASSSTVPLHPAYLGGGVMTLTSSADVGRLLRALFIENAAVAGAVPVASLTGVDARFAAYGTHILLSLKPTAEDSAPRKDGITAIGYGIVQYDASVLCEEAEKINPLPGGCAIGASSLVFGFDSSRSQRSTAGYCMAYDYFAPRLQTPHHKRACIGTTLAYSTSAVQSPRAEVLSPLLVATTNEIFIDDSLISGDTITEESQKRPPLYGFIMFLLVVAAILAVALMAYIAEYFIQPLAVVGPLGNKAYPTLEEHVEKCISRNNESTIRDD